MQANIRWTPPSGALGRLSERARERAATLASSLSDLKARSREMESAPQFATALRRGANLALIAEIKRESPSKGVINNTIIAAERAVLYATAGASALSILTEPSEFGGRSEDLSDVRRHVRIPLIKKDFHVHLAQIWEARVLGASAALLIARALGPGELERFADECRLAGIEPLVEVRSDDELASAIASGAEVIGVNARDLETLIIEPEVSARLLPSIPTDRVRVAESGLTTVADVERAASMGADAVLVGSSLSASDDPDATARAFASVARQRAP
ncbi:MAG: indole-3-glycerol-phosphate synthase [Gemmatimonadaceae bacterium]